MSRRRHPPRGRLQAANPRIMRRHAYRTAAVAPHSSRRTSRRNRRRFPAARSARSPLRIPRTIRSPIECIVRLISHQKFRHIRIPQQNRPSARAIASPASHPPQERIRDAIGSHTRKATPPRPPSSSQKSERHAARPAESARERDPTAASAIFARSRARSASTCTNAFKFDSRPQFSSAIRPKCASTNSTGDTARVRTCSAISTAERKFKSFIVNSSKSCQRARQSSMRPAAT